MEAHGWLSRVEAIDEVIRAGAETSETNGALQGDILEALYGAGLFKPWVPHAAGGAELAVPSALRVFERVSEADGATGWCVMIGAGAGLFGAFLEHASAVEILGGREDVIAGSGAPSGRAVPVAGGYRATGRWTYASGAPHATWFTANCVVEGQGTVHQPVIRAIAVPREQVEVIETWNVSGMRATGSHDIAVDGVHVPQEHTFSVFDDEPVEPGPLYQFPFAAIAALSFAPVALGIARRAFAEFAALSASKVPSGSTGRLGDVPEVQVRYAEATAIVASARGYLYSTAESQWASLLDGTPPDDGGVMDAQLAATHAVAASARAIDLLHDVAGMDVLNMSSALGRCWRDIHAVTQNRAVSALRWAEAGGHGIRTATGG